MLIPDALIEPLGFLGAYLALGPVGLRYSVVAPALAGHNAPRERSSLAPVIDRRAAWLGIVGAALSGALVLIDALQSSAEDHVAVTDLLLRSHGQGAVAVALWTLALIGFALIIGTGSRGWLLAGLGTLGAALSSLVALKWTSMVNPVHIVAGGLWIGTLFVLMTIAIPAVLSGPLDPDGKALAVRDMVYGFSPMALGAAAVLVVSGVTTAVRHVKAVSNLFTTSYGQTLIVKLCFVLVVFGLAAWNWRRVKPTLHTREGAAQLRRSARLELAFAGIVLLITAVLLAMPTPKAP